MTGAPTLRVTTALALALVSLSTVSSTRAAILPAHGVVVPGQSIGGISLGMTQLQVTQHWGSDYVICPSGCALLTWFYLYPGGDTRDGAAISFDVPTPAADRGATAISPISKVTGTASKPTPSSAAAAAKKALAAQAAASRAAAAAKTAEAKALTAKSKALHATATAVSDKAKAKAAKAAGATDATTLEATASRAAAAAKAATADATDAQLAAAKAAAAAALAAANARAAKVAAAQQAASTKGTVVAVFTLGAPVGWGLKGAMMYDPPTNLYTIFGNLGTVGCIGYDALTVKIGQSTTAFYSYSGYIGGFDLTSSSRSPCE